MPASSFALEEDFSDQTFFSLNLKSQVVEERLFENCIFVSCNFGGASFKRCRFIDCTFQGCDLSNWQIHGSRLREIAFKDSKMVGIIWGNASAITHLNLERCVLDFSNFAGLDLRKSLIRECMAREVDFSDANLCEVDCRGTDFAGTRFANTNLLKADFRQALNYSIRPDGNKLKQAKFSLPEATLLLYGLDIVLEE